MQSVVKLQLWKILFDLEVGVRTEFHELKYLNTDFGPIKVGNHCRINASALAGPIEIGNDVLINLLSDISGRDYKVTIGNNVLIAPRVSILASTHNYLDKTRLILEQGITGANVFIDDDVWIGTGAVILPGVHIGHGAVIGANAVVTKDVPSFGVAVGIPAKVICYRE